MGISNPLAGYIGAPARAQNPVTPEGVAAAIIIGVCRLIANHLHLPSSKAYQDQKSGSFPPPALPGFNGHTTLSDSRRCRPAAADNMAWFGDLFGWKGIEGDIRTEQQEAGQIKMRQKTESKIKSKIMGKQSGLSTEAQAQLQKWDRLFNLEVHRSLFSWARAGQRLIVDRDLGFELGPRTDDLADAINFGDGTVKLVTCDLQISKKCAAAKIP